MSNPSKAAVVRKAVEEQPNKAMVKVGYFHVRHSNQAAGPPVHQPAAKRKQVFSGNGCIPSQATSSKVVATAQRVITISSFHTCRAVSFMVGGFVKCLLEANVHNLFGSGAWWPEETSALCQIDILFGKRSEGASFRDSRDAGVRRTPFQGIRLNAHCYRPGQGTPASFRLVPTLETL